MDKLLQITSTNYCDIHIVDAWRCTAQFLIENCHINRKYIAEIWSPPLTASQGIVMAFRS